MAHELLQKLNQYEIRQAFNVGLAVFFAVIVNHYLALTGESWMIMTAFLIGQTTRGTPLRQGLIYCFLIACLALILPPYDYGMARDRLFDIGLGAFIVFVLSQWIFPIRIYNEFSLGVLPILRALLADTHALSQALAKPQHAEQFTLKQHQVEAVFAKSHALYPEWVYEVGFNPGLRSGFRFFLIHIERMTEIFFSLHYLVNRCVREGIKIAFFEEMRDVLETNIPLLHSLIDHFEGRLLGRVPDGDLTSDMIALESALQRHVSVPIELLDLSPEYLPLVGLVRDLKDMREILIKLSMAITVPPYERH